MNTIGKYTIIEELGRGGMGVIYKALDPDINREVAVKLIRSELLEDGPQGEKTLKQFMIEAQAAGRLNHPHIATIYEVGRQAGQTYIVMQYIAGGSLRRSLDSGRKFSVEEVADLAVPILRALDYAHQSGIVHRDIKPDNILLDEAGQPYLVDFGIATIESVNITRTRTTSATPAYMSPEQVLECKVDARSDIFSLGVILFEMLAGKRPFLGENIPSLLNKIVNDEPAKLVARTGPLPEGFEDVLRKALAKKPEDRWATAGELADALEECVRPMEQTTVLKMARKTMPITTAARRKTRPKSRLSGLLRTPAGTIAGIVLAAAVLVGLLLAGRRLLGPAPDYENLIAIVPFAYETSDIPSNLIEFVLDRSLTASTRIPVLTRRMEDLRTNSEGVRARKPLVRVSGKVVPTLTGFEVDLTIVHKSLKKRRVFPCKGNLDFISTRIDEILTFLKANAGETIGSIEGGRTFAGICTSNWDALSHFLKGQDAWEKLDSEPAEAELKTVLEYDSDFALARLKAAEVALFRSEREDARIGAEAALAGSARLIGYDLLRLKALLARIASKPSEERGYLMQLKEAFPLKREYLYEFAESYFHTGDGGEAGPYYAKALALDDAYALAHNHIAFCYAWTGDHAKAEEHFRRYVELDKTANSYDSMAAGFMFAGRYAAAVEALDEGRALDPKLDYLYSNYATNYHLVGALAKAEDSLKRQADVTSRESTRVNIQVTQAYIASLRGDTVKAEELLRPTLAYYGAPAFAERLDESPVLPLWLSGCLAAQRNDAPRLRAVMAELSRRAEAKGLNATNYFPILKFLVHLKALEARQRKDAAGVMAAIDEAQRIKPKMGYWTSPFNRAYFMDEFARIVLELDPASAKPKELLDDVLAYNDSYPPALLRRARLMAADKDWEGARRLAARARQVLAGADPDSLLAKELAEIGRLLGGRP